MSIEKVVINASPFILLCKCGLIELLPQLFSEIGMPKSVSEEITRGGDIAAERIYEFEETWLRRYLVPHAKEVLAWNLGDGETEVLSVAFANKGTFVALVDDRAARKCADTLGIRTLGNRRSTRHGEEANLGIERKIRTRKIRNFRTVYFG